MQDLTKKMGFIVGFLILTMIVDASLGHSIATKFLLVVLASMLILNSGKVVNWVKTNFI